MKKCSIFLYLWPFTVVLFFASCNKDPLDFSGLHHVEADGAWGLPLMDAKISINQILNHIDSIDYLSITNDKNISFVYEIFRDDLLKASGFLRVDNKYFNGSNTLTGIVAPPDLEQFSVDIDSIRCDLNPCPVYFAQIKSGTLSFTFNAVCPVPFSGEFRTDELRTPSGEPLTIHVSSDNNADDVDLTGYSILLDADRLVSFSGRITLYLDGSPVAHIPYDYEIDLKNLKFSKASFSQYEPYEIPFDEVEVLDLNLSHVTGDVAIINPRLSLYSRNSFKIKGVFNVDTAKFLAPDGSFSSLITGPAEIECPVSPNHYIGGLVEEVSSIYFDTKYNKFKATGKFVLNPDGVAAGEVTIDENESIGMKINAEVPLNILISDLIYRDTSDNVLMNASDMDKLDAVEKLTLRLAITNGLPLDVLPQICFLNSSTEEKDTLFLRQPVPGGYNNVPYELAPIYVDYSTQKTKRILQCDKIILTFRFSTNKNTIQLQTGQFVNAKISAKVQYTTFPLEF